MKARSESWEWVLAAGLQPVSQVREPAGSRPHRVVTSLQFQSFDAEYVRRLADGDSVAGDHFASYFNNVLYLKLRVRLRSRELIEDVKQETMTRVLVIIRQNGVKQPERFGAFVNAVCNNVMRELCRLERRHEPWDDAAEEPADSSVDLDAPLVNADLRRGIEATLRELQERDGQILRAVFLDELEKDEICRRFSVDAAYLRVLLHRAKAHFREICRAPSGTRKSNGGSL